VKVLLLAADAAGAGLDAAALAGLAAALAAAGLVAAQAEVCKTRAPNISVARG